MHLSRIPFTVLLPLLSLVLATLLVAVPITFTLLNFDVLAQHSTKAVIAGSLEIPRSEFLRRAVIFGTIKTAHAITAIDMPGIIATIPQAPANLPFEAWRALIMPFSSLPFWWFAGLGFDTLSRRVRLHWSIFLLGSLLMVGFLILGLGLRFGVPASDREDMAWPIYGMALWTILFASFPIAWGKSRRSNKENN